MKKQDPLIESVKRSTGRHPRPKQPLFDKPKKQSKMFPFITCTWNPIGGVCPYNCVYCWAKALINRHEWAKYKGPPFIYKKQINKTFDKGDFVFVQSMTDLFAPNVPNKVISDVLWQIKKSPLARFLLLTKNPTRYAEFLDTIPFNCVFGATIESDIHYPQYSQAPEPNLRLFGLHGMTGMYSVPAAISIEPIMKFSDQFAKRIIAIKPKIVAIGYDNYNNKLPEPTLDETYDLAETLTEANITIYFKTMREAWDETS